jgi:hypothetical protein
LAPKVSHRSPVGCPIFLVSQIALCQGSVTAERLLLIWLPMPELPMLTLGSQPVLPLPCDLSDLRDQVPGRVTTLVFFFFSRASSGRDGKEADISLHQDWPDQVAPHVLHRFRIRFPG